MPRRHPLSIVLLMVLGICLVGPAFGAKKSPAGAGYIPLQVNASGDVSAAKISAVIQKIAAQVPVPQHIVVLVHGFATPAHPIPQVYERIAALTHAAFAKVGQSVQVVGLEWPVGTGLNMGDVQKMFHQTSLGLGKDSRFYLPKVVLAGKVGRKALRRLLLSLDEKYSNAGIHVFTHNLGSEVLMRSFKKEDASHKSDYYGAGRVVDVDVACFAGADADQDRTRAPKSVAGGAKLYWITMARPGEKRDRIAALGDFIVPQKATAPDMIKLSESQLDKSLSKGSLVFDTFDIPATEEILSYYTEDRVQRLADAAATLQNPNAPRSDVLKRMRTVLTAPESIDALSKYLKDEDLTVVFYALWRLDRMVCGSCKHLSDGTLREALTLSLRTPAKLEKERPLSRCKLVKDGIWPPEGRSDD